MMNVKRMILPVDDEEVQSKAKVFISEIIFERD
jgi:hypothetical protein